MTRLTTGETIRAFVRTIGPRYSTLYENLSVIPVNTVEEMGVRFKSYTDLEMKKEGKKAHKKFKKEIHEGKKLEHHPQKGGHQDDKRHRLVTLINREVYETFTPLNQEISVILNDLEKRDWASPLSPRKNRAHMGSDQDQYCRYHRCKGHSTDDCRILKRDIETLIQKGILKNFVAKRGRIPNPSCKERRASPRAQERSQEDPRAKRGTLNVISRDFASGG